MKIEKRETTVYIADDGKEFLDEKKCKQYEEEVLEEKKNIKYFETVANPDLCEGRGYNTAVFFAVCDKSFCHLERCLQWLINNKGKTIDYVQGCASMPNWKIPREITEQEFQNAEPGTIGDNKRGVQQIFISKKAIEGLPEPIWVE